MWQCPVLPVSLKNMFCLPKLLHLRCCCCSGLLLPVLPPLFRGLTCQSRNIQVHFKVVKLNISERGKIVFWKFQPGTHQTYLNLTHLGSSEHPTFNIDENHHLTNFTWPDWVKSCSSWNLSLFTSDGGRRGVQRWHKGRLLSWHKCDKARKEGRVESSITWVATPP